MGDRNCNKVGVKGIEEGALDTLTRLKNLIVWVNQIPKIHDHVFRYNTALISM